MTTVMYVDRTLKVQPFSDELGSLVRRFIERLSHEPWRQKLMLLPTASKPIIDYPPFFGANCPADATGHSLLDRDNPVQEAGNLAIADDSLMPSRSPVKHSRTMTAHTLHRNGVFHQPAQTTDASRDARDGILTARTSAHQ